MKRIRELRRDRLLVELVAFLLTVNLCGSQAIVPPDRAPGSWIRLVFITSTGIFGSFNDIVT